MRFKVLLWIIEMVAILTSVLLANAIYGHKGSVYATGVASTTLVMLLLLDSKNNTTTKKKRLIAGILAGFITPFVILSLHYLIP